MHKKIIPFSSFKKRRFWLKKLGGLDAPQVKNLEWLELLVDDGRNTLSIEGEFNNKWDLKEIFSNPKYQKESMRTILNFFDAALFAYEYAYIQMKDQKFEITVNLIKQIHYKMFHNVPRVFTQAPGTWAAGERKINKSKIVLVAPNRIESVLRDLLWYVHNLKAEPTRKAAIFHAFFEYIHPFPDGNGRVGRILLNFILITCGLPPIAIKGIKEADRKKYYHALEESDKEVSLIIKRKKSFRDLDFLAFAALENLLEKPLAIAMDIVICRKFELEIKKELIKVRKLARALGRNENSFSVACAQKKYISVVRGNVSLSHRDLIV